MTARPQGNQRDRSTRDWRQGVREAGPLLGLGMQMALTMALFAGGGFWLDRRLGTTPLFTLVGTALAIAVLAVYLVRLLRQLNRHGRGDSDG